MLDLRYRGKWDPDSTKLLNQISMANRKNYNDLITNIYDLRDSNDLEVKNSPIRLHSSTLDAPSTFACISAILENRITMGKTVKDYENSYREYLGRTHNVLSCNSGSSANLLAISALIQYI